MKHLRVSSCDPGRAVVTSFRSSVSHSSRLPSSPAFFPPGGSRERPWKSRSPAMTSTTGAALFQPRRTAATAKMTPPTATGPNVPSPSRPFHRDDRRRCSAGNLRSARDGPLRRSPIRARSRRHSQQRSPTPAGNTSAGQTPSKCRSARPSTAASTPTLSSFSASI